MGLKGDDHVYHSGYLDDATHASLLPRPSLTSELCLAQHNRIKTMQGLECNPSLRVINLANNCLSTVSCLQHLTSITELNLRRNKISNFTCSTRLDSLQRLFLSDNSILAISTLSDLFAFTSLQELTLDGNPLSSEGGYRMAVLDCIHSLKHFDLR